MAHLFGRYTRQVISLVIVLIWCFNLNAQNANPIKTVFSIGAIGTTGSTSPIYSGPMVLDASSCIKLFSGLSTYNATNPGLFVSSCIVPAINNKPLTLICYPNPASTTVWVKTAQPVAETSSSVSLLLIGSDGKIVGAYTTSVAQLSTGFAIDLTSKAAGVYFIRHTANAQTGELKIIKVH